MVDNDASKFFADQRPDPFNSVCCDLGTPDAQWASVSHGIYISISASGAHRSLGVKTSFVLSTTMDAWKPDHRRMMELGGNQRFQDFLREHGIPEDLPIRQKYTTRAAEWYRLNLRAEAEGLTRPHPLPPGTGCLPTYAARQQSSQGIRTSQMNTMEEAQAVLDAVFAGPGLHGVGSGTTKAAPQLQRHHSTSASQADRSSAGSPSVRLLAANIQRAVKGHSTAMMLRSFSSGRMEGYGSDTSMAQAVIA
jgi:ADP-ribosylation factor GTPase-activating protein 1